MIIDKPRIEDLPILCSLWEESFGDGEDFFNMFVRTAFSTERSRCIFMDGRVVASLYWFDCSYPKGKLAYLYAISTTEKYRGRGLCRALMEDTHNHLRELGYVGAVLVPSTASLFAFYEKLGYSVCSEISEIKAEASDTICDIRSIDKEEYVLCRSMLLPQNGVVQDKENINFLKEQYDLYKGKDFLMAATKKNGTLYCTEFLGNTTVFPSVLKSLRVDEGVFRCVGKERQFAMYHPLTENGRVSPEYFGLAFD